MENCSKYELFFPYQANSSSDLSQILMLQHPIPILLLSPPPFLSNFTLQNWNFSSITLIILFINLPLPYSTTRHRHWIYKNICQAKPVKSSIMHIQIIKRYMGQTDLYQKVESLRAISFSTLDNMFKSNSIFNTKQVEFCTKW